MKRLFYLSLLVSIALHINAQAPIPAWANKIGSDGGNDIVKKVDVDHLGNVYVAGTFSSPSLTLGSTTLTNPLSGSTQSFVAKYNSNGVFQWARSGGSSTDDDFVSALFVDQLGVLLAGGFAYGNITFGSNTVNQIGGADAYLVMYDLDGNLQWLKVFGGASNDYINDVCFNPSGDVLITGTFQSSINFGTTTLTAVSGYDIFVTSLNSSNGSEIWAKSFGGIGGFSLYNYEDFGNAIVADLNYVYVTGTFNNAKISFTPGDTLVNKNAGGEYSDVFLVKLDGTNGNTIWSKSMGGNCFDHVYDIDLDNIVNNGNVYVSGSFNCKAYFGEDSLSANGYPGNGISQFSDMFLAKIDKDGNFLWAKRFGSIGYEEPYSCSADDNGNVAVTLYSVSGTGLTFANQSLPIFGNQDVYLLYYDQSGNEIWGQSYGTSSYEYGYSCKVNRQNSFPIYVGGAFESSSITFGSYTLTSSDQSGEGFLVKLSESTTNSINDATVLPFLNIYPNPSADFIQVQTNEYGTIDIYSIEGKLMQTEIINQAIHLFDISTYPAGMYLLKFTADNGHVNQSKFIKE